jgi:hypothetical protein
MDDVLRKALVLAEPENFLRRPLAAGTAAQHPFPQATTATPEIITH